MNLKKNYEIVPNCYKFGQPWQRLFFNLFFGKISNFHLVKINLLLISRKISDEIDQLLPNFSVQPTFRRDFKLC